MSVAFGRWPWFWQVGAVGAACLAALLAFELLWVAPQREVLAARRGVLEEKRREAEQARRAEQRLPALEGSVEELETSLARLQGRLPARRDAAALLRRLEVAAARSDLTIRAFVPQAPAERSWYAEWPIHLELSGTYRRLGLFFERVARFDRIINLQDIVIRALDPSRPNETITAECTATTFVVLEAPETTGPARRQAADREQ